MGLRANPVLEPGLAQTMALLRSFNRLHQCFPPLYPRPSLTIASAKQGIAQVDPKNTLPPSLSFLASIGAVRKQKLSPPSTHTHSLLTIQSCQGFSLFKP